MAPIAPTDAMESPNENKGHLNASAISDDAASDPASLSKSSKISKIQASKLASDMAKNKQQQLNRFLSKTFHCINQCDPSIACWAPDGESFVVFNVDEFAENVLPLYFKHSKFTSFVRQLNFYGFRKLRLETAVLNKDESKSASVRFYHEYFQRDKPELLHRIQRATKSAEPPNSTDVDSLQQQVAALKDQLSNVAETMDRKLAKMQAAIELDYQRRIAHVELGYQDLLRTVMLKNAGSGLFPGMGGFSPAPSPSILALFQHRAEMAAALAQQQQQQQTESRTASPSPSAASKEQSPLDLLCESAASRLSPPSSNADIQQRLGAVGQDYSSLLRGL